ncbi:MAG: hypothetical protein ACREQ5_17450, partial [Candidatus Dormibacteria bacterium]
MKSGTTIAIIRCKTSDIVIKLNILKMNTLIIFVSAFIVWPANCSYLRRSRMIHTNESRVSRDRLVDFNLCTAPLY